MSQPWSVDAVVLPRPAPGYDLLCTATLRYEGNPTTYLPCPAVCRVVWSDGCNPTYLDQEADAPRPSKPSTYHGRPHPRRSAKQGRRTASLHNLLLVGAITTATAATVANVPITIAVS